MAYTAPIIADPRTLDPHKRWISEITYAEKELEKFYQRGRRVVRRFVDERDAIDATQKWVNLFYANTKIMKAASYAQVPKPEVCRKFKDFEDDLGRVAANILQRCVSPDGDDPRDLFDSSMQYAVLDRLVPGLAQVWLRLETDTEEARLSLPGYYQPYNTPPNSGFKTGPAPDEMQAQAGLPGPGHEPPPQPMAPPQMPPGGDPLQGGPQPPMAPPGAPMQPPQPMAQPQPTPQVLTYQRITDQRVCIDYVYWEDFLWSPCRVWEERRWVGRKVYLTKEELVKRFGEEVASQVPLNHRPASLNLSTFPQGLTPEHQVMQLACVYEIWDRMDRKVYWVCKDCPFLLDEKDDFLGLVGFEPCPKPMLANVTTSNTVPRPDFYMVQDQYNELDTLNQRIHLLTRAVKVVAVYDSSASGVQRLLSEGTDNDLIPVDSWAIFAEKGGLKGSIDWLPLDTIVLALQRLYEGREMVKAQIYELTGISDIVRGASKASETLGAQELKAKFASVRIKDVQDEVANFASEVLRLKAEIMVKHFDAEILKRKSNILRTKDAALADEAIELLQSEEGFEWRIFVTSDQLAQADYAMDKQDRTELLGAIAGYLPQAANMIQTMPQSAPLLVGIMKWVLAGFKGARDIEGMLDKELDNMLQQQQQQANQPPPPSPEEQKAKAEMEMMQAKAQGDMQAQQMRLQADMQSQKIKQQGMLADLQFSQAKHAQDLRANALKHAQTLRQKQDATQLGTN